MSRIVKLGLLGNNLSRSRAKNLHELLGEMHGLKVTYEPMDLIHRPMPVSIAEELKRCRSEGYRGVNVTHPYKREAFAHVATLPGFPRGLTSVNTVLFSEDGTVADNTDFTGAYRALRTRFGEDFRPGRVLMLGAGGVGVAIAHALSRLGVEELVVRDLNESAALELVDRMRESQRAVRLADPDLAAEMRQADGLINATPIGMFQYPGNPFPDEGFASQKWAFDAVYTPERTQFLQRCGQCSIEILTGFYLFLYQGLDAFERFTGIQADPENVKRVFLEKFPLAQ